MGFRKVNCTNFCSPAEVFIQPWLCTESPWYILGKVGMGALKGVSTIAYNCRHFATKIPLQKRHKCAQLQTIVHELQRVALSLWASQLLMGSICWVLCAGGLFSEPPGPQLRETLITSLPLRPCLPVRERMFGPPLPEIGKKQKNIGLGHPLKLGKKSRQK